jgi:hypothetical protein
MARFTWDDIVRLRASAAHPQRTASKAWIVAVMPDRTDMTLSRFPAGAVYTVEFEDGIAIDIHEDDLEPFCEDG